RRAPTRVLRTQKKKHPAPRKGSRGQSLSEVERGGGLHVEGAAVRISEAGIPADLVTRAAHAQRQRRLLVEQVRDAEREAETVLQHRVVKLVVRQGVRRHVELHRRLRAL